ncbi:amidase [Cyclobacterium lianum]|uniref:Amidase n=1 Tax=Cyclobacterium lianum TaxID=388280 RepID=A0A1M7QFF6_9BACT|nr:amidase [Cyclobacterium lianum]SHN29319.1 amidase [Cyclobacterium lianum]
MNILFRLVKFHYFLFLVLFYSCTVQQENENGVMDFPYEEWTIEDFHRAYEDGSLSVREVVEAYLSRIEDIDQAGPELKSVLQVNPDALAIADSLDLLRIEGNASGNLFGIPVLLKDNLDTHDQMATTAGSRALAGSKPLKDSFVAKKLRESGAVILGKANLSEWANFRGELSSSGWSGLGGQTKNPYYLDRNPCGSSSGSAVAVSANLSVLAIGTETNGSIVCPSHANGIVGIKPTVGLVSRSGVIPISFTQDTPGPMARTVRDAAIALGCLVGVDPEDEKTLASAGNYQSDYLPFLKEDGLKNKRIGWFKGPSGRNFKVDQLMQEAVAEMERQGAVIIPIEEVEPSGTGAHSFEVMLYEYKDGLNRYFAGLGPDAPIRSLEDLIRFNKEDSISLENYNQVYLEQAQEKGDLREQAYLDALASLNRMSREEGIDKALQTNDLDAIIAPTGSPAWKTDWVNGDSFQLGSSSPAAHAGYPNITLPMGFVGGLPVGISVFGTAWSEPALLEIAYAYEQGTHYRKPPKFIGGNH